MFLNIARDQLVAQKALWTAKEIAQQPQTWRETAQLVANSNLGTFLNPLIERAKLGQLRIIFTGAGTSAFIGYVIAPLLQEKFQCVVESIATTDLVSSPEQFLFPEIPTLLVSFGRSGDSPESIGAVDNVDRIVKDAYHLVITNNRNGALFKASADNPKAEAIALPDCTHDQGFAMTSSASNMMLAALLSFAPEHFSNKWLENVIIASKTLLEKDAKTIENFAREGNERIVYLGSGAFQGLARECALKLLELTAGDCLGFFESQMGFRHGPKSLVQDKTMIVLFDSCNPYTALYEKDLHQELVNDQKAQRIVHLNGQNMEFNFTLDDLDDAGRVFPFLVFGQLYAFYSSFFSGITTDNPCPTGEVNRVVKGVTLYPYN